MANTSSPSIQFITLTLLILPTLTIVLYFLTVFPHNPDSIIIHPSLSTLSKDTRSWQIYPSDFFEGGAYVTFPYGRVSDFDNLPVSPIKLIVSFRCDTGCWVQRMVKRSINAFFLSPQFLIRPQVVLIHGLSVPSIIWREIAPQLAQKGFRVLLYGAYIVLSDTTIIHVCLRSIWTWLLRCSPSHV